MTLPRPQTEVALKVEAFTDESRDRLIEELELATKTPKNKRTEKLSQIMKKQYEFIKDASGVSKLFETKRPESVNQNAFAKLRPLTPYKLEELLDPYKAKQLVRFPKKEENKGKRKSVLRFKLEGKNLEYSSFDSTKSAKKKSLISGWSYTPKIRLSLSRDIMSTKSRLSNSFGRTMSTTNQSFF